MESIFGFYFLSWTSLLQSTFWMLLGVFVMGVLITGLYPAWLVMGRNPSGLFGKISRQRAVYNTVFTTLQYSIAIVIAVLAFTINGQLNFILNTTLALIRNKSWLSISRCKSTQTRVTKLYAQTKQVWAVTK
jgi:hypothetical protein